ncbi:MAG: exosome complex RNA-binding protein Csl4 [Candidatus Heimdallarchaeota archaeon]
MSKKHQNLSSERRVLPGDKIAVIEEFLPDETCYEQDGSIYSSVTGRVVTDPQKHKISVEPDKQYQTIKPGDIGIGRVEFVKNKMASVEIYRLNERETTPPIKASLYIWEVSRSFVKNMYEVVRPGDWVRCRLVRTDNVVDVGLVGEGLGVIQAFCNHCGSELEFKRRNTLKCPNCELIQPRITSRQYGRLVG